MQPRGGVNQGVGEGLGRGEESSWGRGEVGERHMGPAGCVEQGKGKRVPGLEGRDCQAPRPGTAEGWRMGPRRGLGVLWGFHGVQQA